jgi:hypothetical protein
MRKSLIAGIAVFGLGFGLFVTAPKARAADEKEIKGVLIDDHCSANMMKKDNPEKAADAHKKACCEKCMKGGAELSIISGKTEYKLDSASQEKAKEYLEKKDSSTKVMVKGEEKDGKLSISSIESQK